MIQKRYGYQNLHLNLLMQVRIKTTRRKKRWYLDSGCSRHMTWDVNNFATLSRMCEGDYVTFRDDSKGKIIGFSNVKIGTSLLIENISLFDGLKHNLLSINQLYDKDLKIVFDSTCCNVIDKYNACLLTCYRKNNVYIINMLNLDSNLTCLTDINEESWL